MTDEKIITNAGDGEAMLAHQDSDNNKVVTKAPDNIEDIRLAGRLCARACVDRYPGRKPNDAQARVSFVAMFGCVRGFDPRRGPFVESFLEEVKDLPENPRVDFISDDGCLIEQLEIPYLNASQTHDWINAVGAGRSGVVRAACAQTGQAWLVNEEGAFELEEPEDA